MTNSDIGGAGTIICDTDAGTDVDDYLAITYLVNAAPERLKLIVTDYGPVETRAKAVTRLLRELGVDIPVVPGEKELLTPGLDIWLTNTEENYADSSIKIADGSMQDSYLAHDNFTLLSIGALTNIAIMLENTEFSKRCKRIVIMGGSFDPEGLLPMDKNSPAFEQNFFADPVATQRVIRSEIPKVIIPLDLTIQHTMSEEHFSAFSSSLHPHGRMLSDMIMSFREATRDPESRFVEPFIDRVHWHDAIAAAYITHPQLFTTEQIDVDIADDGAVVVGKGNPVLVCREMELDVISLLINTILKKPLPNSVRLNRTVANRTDITNRIESAD